MNNLPFEKKKEIPMCTLKIFPTKIEHCIEFSKIVFKELFEQYIADIKLIIEDEQQFYNIINETNDTNQLYLILEIYKHILYILENPSHYTIIKYSLFIFTYYFEYIINHLIKDNTTSSSNININNRPSPLKINLNDNNIILYFKSFYYILSDIINFNEELNIEIIKEIVYKVKFSINEEILDKQKS